MFHIDLAPFGADNARLKKQRLGRLQAAMKKQGLAALMLTGDFNIRYATDTVFMYDIRATGIQRYVLVPAEGVPVIVERDTLGLNPPSPGRRVLDAFMFSMRPAAATQDFVAQTAGYLREMGITDGPVGVDALNLETVEGLKAAGIHLVDGWRALHQARAVKTVDEIELIRWATRAKERGMDKVRKSLHEGDVREDRLSRMMMDSLLDEGCEVGSEFMAIWDSSRERPHNEPGGTDMVVVEGDLVVCDAPMASPGGYYSDFARTFSRGKPTPASRSRYQEAYETLQTALPLIKAGPCTELFDRFGKHSTKRLPGLDGFHGIGLCLYEAPWLRGGDPLAWGDVTLEENMIIALEINHHPVKLEHLLRVKSDGVEVLDHYPMDPELVPA